MTDKEQFIALHDAYIKARSNKEKNRIFEELTELIFRNPSELAEVYSDIAHGLAERSAAVYFRQQIKPVLGVLNAKALAARIGKSPAWLSQRMNGHLVNGAEAVFSNAEMERLEEAIHEIGNELLSFHVKLPE